MGCGRYGDNLLHNLAVNKVRQRVLSHRQGDYDIMRLQTKADQKNSHANERGHFRSQFVCPNNPPVTHNILKAATVRSWLLCC